MGASNFPGLAIPKGLPQFIEKGFKRQSNKARMDSAFDKVDDRDSMVSRISGRRLFTTGDRKQLRVHAHVFGRRVRPDLKYESAHIFNCSWTEHEYFDAHAIVLDGTFNANKTLRFKWNRAVIPAGKEPFRLLRSSKP